METIGDRIKYLRKTKLDKTQKEFGDRLGLKPNSISDIESGKNNPTQQTIKAICREFGINEDWLVNGTGGPDNMWIPEDMTYIQNVGKLGNEKNEFKKFYLNTMMNLSDDFWDYIYNEFKKFSDKKGE